MFADYSESSDGLHESGTVVRGRSHYTQKHGPDCSRGTYRVSNSGLIPLEISERDDCVSISCSRQLK